MPLSCIFAICPILLKEECPPWRNIPINTYKEVPFQ